MSKTDLIAIEKIEKAIYLIRGEKVMLDRDLASFTMCRPKRSIKPYAEISTDFQRTSCSSLQQKEVVELNRSQIVIGSQKHRDPRFRPYAFTEQGVAMLSSVLRSKRAISVNIEIMRAFVKLRQMFASNQNCSPAGRTRKKVR